MSGIVVAPSAPVAHGTGRTLLVIVAVGAVLLVTHGPAIRASSLAPGHATDLRQEVARAIDDELQSGRDIVTGRPVPPVWGQVLAALYPSGASRQLLWLDDVAWPNGNARLALRALQSAQADGLTPARYGVAGLESIVAELSTLGSDVRFRRAATFEVGLSTNLLLYLWHRRHGRVAPESLGVRVPQPAPGLADAVELRRACLENRLSSLIDQAGPSLNLYRGLRASLAEYRTRAAARSPSVSLPDDVAMPGRPYAAVESLRATLTSLGDLAEDDPGAGGVYAGSIVDGVRRFQVRHGLDPDGVVGSKTLAELRVPPSWRLRQIELSLERLRWLPTLEGRVIGVNIPMFRLWGWDTVPSDPAPSISMEVIVGRAFGARTPVVIEDLRQVTFRPYWNVPNSIVRSEILPHLASDPDYLHARQMEIVSGQGDGSPAVPVSDDAVAALSQGQLRLRQRPGPANALGRVKFVFPNRESVYLHDTPSTELFSRPRRDFSHGCVRVSAPAALAEWVLRNEGGWEPARIDAAMNGDTTLTVTLAHPIRVVLFYLTAAVMPGEETVHFAPDIYGRDRVLDQAMQQSDASF